MDETPDQNADEGVNREGLRRLADMRRTSDDRMVAGVCGGVARHLNIDPIVVRIAFVALTFIGLSGLILYLAVWFLIPSDDDPRSVAADWFNLDENEEQVRTIGLFVALVLAVVAVVGDGGWGLWWLGWWAIPAAFLFWLFVVRPRNRRAEALATMDTPTWSDDPDVLKTQVEEFTAWKTTQVLERKRQRIERRQEARVLRGLTLSVVLIAEAIALIVDRTLVNLPGPAYVAIALTVVAVGCLVGAFWGSASGLVAIGTLLTVALLVTSSVPTGRIGHQQVAPATAGAVNDTYRHGVGQLELDLSHIAQPRTSLVGRTITVNAGIGQTVIYVPDTVAVKLDVDLRAGEINAFGQQWHGRNNSEKITDGDPKQALHLVVNQRFGEVKVVRR